MCKHSWNNNYSKSKFVLLFLFRSVVLFVIGKSAFRFSCNRFEFEWLMKKLNYRKKRRNKSTSKRLPGEIIKNQNNNKSEYIIILIANINKKLVFFFDPFFEVVSILNLDYVWMLLLFFESNKNVKA